jgi:hypothetical protein
MPKYFEFEVAVKDIKPRIWRRFLLPVTASFRHLHDAIQDSSGAWVDYHLHSFQATGRGGPDICGTPTDPDDVYVGDTPAPDSRKVRLASWFPSTPPLGPRPKCVYAYDFGDGWKVDVQLRAIVDTPEKFRRRLLAGARRFPMEDCGGTWGYQKCCDTLARAAGGPPMDDDDPEEWTEHLEWMGPWRPDDWKVADEQADFELPARRSIKGKVW